MSTALTASGRSPERRRIQEEGCRSGLTGPTTTTLRGRKERTGSSGNVCKDWGYLARLWQTQEDRCRLQEGRLGSERKSLAPQVKQRVFDGAETLAKLLILNGLLKLTQRRHLRFGTCSTWLPSSRPKRIRTAVPAGTRGDRDGSRPRPRPPRPAG